MLGPRVIGEHEGKKLAYYNTDVGWLTAADIAKRMSWPRKRVPQRYERTGWDHPDMFSESEELRRNVYAKATVVEDEEVDPVLQAECLKLSTRPRDKPLHHLELGTWERSHYDPYTDETGIDRDWRR